MNNTQKKTYVINCITQSLITLLENRELYDISIGEITTHAMVSRNSFYRHFDTKEAILKAYIYDLLTRWKKDYDKNASHSTAELFGSLFQHLKENGTFYQLLKKRQLFYLFHEVYLKEHGAQSENSNIEAYTKNFIAYGVLGWIEEWLNRGMQEAAETMVTLLNANGMA